MGEGGQNADSPHWEIPSRGGPWHLLWLDISKKVAEARISSQNAWEMVNVEGFAHARHTAAAFFGESNSAVCQSKVLRLTNHRYPLSDLAGPPRQGRQKVADSRNPPPPPAIRENEIKLLLKKCLHSGLLSKPLYAILRFHLNFQKANAGCHERKRALWWLSFRSKHS